MGDLRAAKALTGAGVQGVLIQTPGRLAGLLPQQVGFPARTVCAGREPSECIELSVACPTCRPSRARLALVRARAPP